jgi:hypothetical protein
VLLVATPDILYESKISISTDVSRVLVIYSDVDLNNLQDKIRWFAGNYEYSYEKYKHRRDIIKRYFNELPFKNASDEEKNNFKIFYESLQKEPMCVCSVFY